MWSNRSTSRVLWPNTAHSDRSVPSATAGVHLEVLGDQPGGDRMHGGSMGDEHANGFLPVLLKVENLPVGPTETGRFDTVRGNKAGGSSGSAASRCVPDPLNPQR